MSSQSMWRPGAGSGIASFGNGGRRCAPLRRITTRWVRSCQAKLRGRVLRTGARGAWGVMETPGALEVARVPGVNVPVCGVDVRVHERGEMRAATHA